MPARFCLAVTMLAMALLADVGFGEEPPRRLEGRRRVEGVSVEVIGPGRLIKDAPSQYRLIARQRGTADVMNFAVEARLPEHFEVVESEPTGERDGNVLRWRVEKLSVGERRDFVFSVKATSAGTGRVEAMALVMDDPLPDQGVAIAQTDEPAAAEPQNVPKEEDPPALPTPEQTPRPTVTIEAPERAVAGEPFTCVAIIGNEGSAKYEKAGFELKLTEGLVLKRQADQGSGPLSVGPGEERRVLLELVAAQAGTHGIRAFVDAGSGVKVQGEREILVTGSDLSVRLELPREHVMGVPLRFRMFIANNKSEGVRDVQGFVDLPAGLEVVSAEAGALLNRRTRVIRWRLGDLEANEERGFRVTVRPQSASRLDFTARTESADGLKSTQAASLVVQGHTSLGVSLEPSLDVAPLGEEVTVTFDIRSRGTDQASALVVKLSGLEGLEVLAERSTDWKEVEGQWEFQSPGGLGPGQALKAVLVFRATKPGDYLLKGTVTSRETFGEIIRTQPLKVVDIPRPLSTPAKPGT